jgi:hypothetical protein
MVYLDISVEMKAKSLEKIEDPMINIVKKKWNTQCSLAELCGLVTLTSHT